MYCSQTWLSDSLLRDLSRASCRRRRENSDGDQSTILHDGVRIGTFVGKHTRETVLDVLRGNHADAVARGETPATPASRRQAEDNIVRLRKRESALRSLLTALFAQALRCELHGLEPRDAALRIAYGRLEGSALSVGVALERLSAALDDPAQAGARRIEVALDGLALALSPA